MTRVRRFANASIVAAIGPVMLAANNPGEWRPLDLILLLGLTSLVAGAVVLLREWLFRSMAPQPAAMVEVALVAALTLPFLMIRSLAPVLGPDNVPRIRTVLVATLLLVGGSIVWGVRSRANQFRLLSIVITASWAISAIGAVRILAQVLTRQSALRISTTAQTVLQWDADSAARSLGSGERPDVIILLLDAYAGDSLLQSEYGFDHSPMRARLERLGFLPGAGLRSNYAHTFASLSSMLNFTQVAATGGEAIGQSQDAGFLYRLIRENRTARLFAAMGYDVHWAPAPLFATLSILPPSAQRHLAGPPVQSLWLYAPLIHSWLSSVFTPEVALHAVGVHDFDIAAHRDPYLQLIDTLERDGRPSFAFIHLMSTHRPMMYRQDCTVDPGIEAVLTPAASYLAAVSCLDHELLRVLEKAIQASGGNIVIAAVGDHAPAALNGAEGDGPAETVPLSVAKGRTDAAAFLFLPDRFRSRFVAPGSAVNLLPAILNAGFGAQLPYQPDSLYYSRGLPHRLYHFLPLQ